ncbi:hypothetical protein OG900_33085 [Streptomyces sp. NBC_00433]
MTALDDAAQAVEEARSRVRNALCDPPTHPPTGGVGMIWSDATPLVDALITAVRHHDAEVAREFADQEDGLLAMPKAAVYVQGIRDGADRIEPKEGT